MQKAKELQLLGFSFGLIVAMVLSVQPLADVVADHCDNSYDDDDDDDSWDYDDDDNDDDRWYDDGVDGILDGVDDGCGIEYYQNYEDDF